MNLSVQNISSPVVYRGLNIKPGAANSVKEQVSKDMKQNIDLVAGLIDWAMLITGLIGGITYGVVQTIRDKSNTEIKQDSVNNSENNTLTFDCKNV